jgi:hypothetical protein
MNYLEKAKEKALHIMRNAGLFQNEYRLHTVIEAEILEAYEQGLKVGRAEMPKKIEEIVNYCSPHLDEMWAARIVSILIGCDFRDASGELAKRRKEGT